MISLIDIFKILRAGNTPTEKDWKDIMSSLFHKSERLPITQVLGLNDAFRLIEETKANKSDLATLIGGMLPKGEVLTVPDLPKTVYDPVTAPNGVKTGYSYIVKSEKDVNSRLSYIYVAEIIEVDGVKKVDWQNTKLTAYPKDVALESDVIMIADNGKNLFDKSSVMVGYHLNSISGAITQNASGQTFNISPFIPIDEGEPYFLGETGSKTVVGYNGNDADAMKIKINPNDNDFYLSTYPNIQAMKDSGIKFIRFNILDEYLDTCQLEKGTKATLYEDYVAPTTKPVKRGLADIYPRNEHSNGQLLGIENGLPKWKNADFAPEQIQIIGKNLFDKSAIIAGHYINSGSGVVEKNKEGQTFNISPFIAIDEAEPYFLDKTGSKTVVGYDKASEDAKRFKINPNDKDYYLSTYPNIQALKDSGIKFIRFNILDEHLDTCQLEKGTKATAYEEYKVENKVLVDVVKTIYSGKPKTGLVGAFLGDSSLATNTEWVQIAAGLMGLADYKNYAVGGHTWASQTSNGNYVTCVRSQLNRLLSDINNGFKPDFIFINCGGNDLWLNNGKGNLGTFKDAFSEENYLKTDDSTTYGGIRFNIEHIRRNIPDAVLVLGTTFQRVGKDAAPIAQAIREVAERCAIPIIDGYKYSGISPQSEFVNKRLVWNPLKGEKGEYEAITICYNDAPNGTATREYPMYNWVEPDGSVVFVEDKTESAVKRYGLYTYDGTHQNERGAKHIANFMASQLSYILKL